MRYGYRGGGAWVAGEDRGGGDRPGDGAVRVSLPAGGVRAGSGGPPGVVGGGVSDGDVPGVRRAGRVGGGGEPAGGEGVGRGDGAGRQAGVRRNRSVPARRGGGEIGRTTGRERV